MSMSVFPAPDPRGNTRLGFSGIRGVGSGGCKGRPRATVPRESQPL